MARSKDTPPEDSSEFVPAVIARDAEEAEYYRALLSDNDIPVQVGPSQPAGEEDPQREISHGLPVLVPEDKLDEASEIIAEGEDIEGFDQEDGEELEDEEEAIGDEEDELEDEEFEDDEEEGLEDEEDEDLEDELDDEEFEDEEEEEDDELFGDEEDDEDDELQEEYLDEEEDEDEDDEEEED